MLFLLTTRLFSSHCSLCCFPILPRTRLLLRPSISPTPTSKLLTQPFTSSAVLCGHLLSPQLPFVLPLLLLLPPPLFYSSMIPFPLPAPPSLLGLSLPFLSLFALFLLTALFPILSLLAFFLLTTLLPFKSLSGRAFLLAYVFAHLLKYNSTYTHPRYYCQPTCYWR